jgi:putative ABC transport system permease protein
MELIALKMLFADKAKYFGLVLGIIFATLLMSQQVSIFIGLIELTGSQIKDVQEGDIWVMDPELTYIDEIRLMSDSQLKKVRSVEGAQWAVALYKGQTVMRSLDGSIGQSLLHGRYVAS